MPSSLKIVEWSQHAEKKQQAHFNTPNKSGSILQSCVGKNSIEQLQLYNFAERAARLNARPPVISALTGIKNTIAVKIFKDANGISPPKGQLPGDARFYTSTYHRHIESLWLLLTFKNLSFEKDGNIEKIECVLHAYGLYVTQFPIQNVAFDRFFLLIRLAVYGKQITIGSCQNCDGPLFEQTYFSYCKTRTCPICSLQPSQKQASKRTK